MRSRYTAFTLGDLDYIQQTAAGEALLAFDRAALALSLPGTTWLGLEILKTSGGQAVDDAGSVTFKVDFLEGGRRMTQTERSEFRRIGGAWRYVKGEAAFRARSGAQSKVGRNDPCPCGSGRKFKACCGQ